MLIQTYQQQTGRQSLSGIMCLASDAWSMVALGFDANRLEYGRSAATTIIQTLHQ